MGTDDSAFATSATLLMRVRDPRDAQAWRVFIELYTPMIYRYSRRRGLQEADARDVVQEVLVRVQRAIRTFEYDPQRGRFRSWLGTIVARVVSMHLQRQNHCKQAAGDGAQEALLDSFTGDNDPVWLDEFWAQLLRTALARIRGEFDELVWTALWQDRCVEGV